MSAGAAAEGVEPTWRAAALPSLALLGVVLPLAFFPQLEDFLYVLRPAELIPAYGTAWLFLLALAVPLWVILALLLAAVGRLPALRGLRRLLPVGLAGVAAAFTLAALLYCLLMWVQTFGWLRGLSLRGDLLWFALAAGGIAGCTPPGRRAVRRLRPIATACLSVGALCALSVPLLGWSRPPATPPISSPAAAARSPRPNIVLLTIDALSAEHMSLYGAARPTTPQLSAFAAGATTFEHAYADGNFTTPGVASILTGTRPWTHRALQLQAWPDERARLDSLPSLLHRAGYLTGYVSTNSAAGAAKNGFGADFDFAARDRIKDPDLCTDALSALFKYTCAVAAMPLFSALTDLAGAVRAPRDNSHYDPALAIDPALAWLQRSRRTASAPVFLWVHLFPPHAPYAAPLPWLGRFDASARARTIASTEPHWVYSMSSVSPELAATLAARYDESVLYVDHYAGEFLTRALQLLGPDTVLVVTADHGESFRHGYGAHTGPGLFDEIIHVPLIIKLPGQTQAIRSPAVVEQADIAPTLAQLAGLSAPASWEGRSLLGALSSAATGAAPPVVPVFSMNFEQNPRHARLTTGSVAVIDGRWKLVHYLGHLHYPQMPPLHDALYDLAADPGETRNLAAQQPALVARLRALIAAQLARHGGAE
ncbi:MAG TPA: sulfatase [Steroidobacteraceae bacterium]|nr:sulfatase [Steroidobacteraceae bacterium]